MKRILDVLHCRVEDKLKSWASYLPANGDSKATFGEQTNAITVLLRTKYKNYIQAIVVKLAGNVSTTTPMQVGVYIYQSFRLSNVKDLFRFNVSRC